MSRKVKELTHGLALEMVNYDPETGKFSWAKSRQGGRVQAGQEAGSFNRGYIYLFLFGRTYAAGRLAWFLTHGLWPEVHLDHIDGNGLNNRLENLRVASISQNGINKRLAKENTTGAKGVSKKQDRSKYKVSIKVNKKDIYLGTFLDLDEAAHAYNKAAIKHFGDFAVLNPIGVDKNAVKPCL